MSHIQHLNQSSVFLSAVWLWISNTAVINFRNNVCVKCVTFFHNCFSWADVIFCPNSIGSVSCEFNLQTICYTKSRQCLNMAGCCGCVVCYNNTTCRCIVKFDNKLNKWSKRIISDVKVTSAGWRRLPWRPCSCPWRRRWKRWTSDVTTGPLVWCADPTLAQT